MLAEKYNKEFFKFEIIEPVSSHVKSVLIISKEKIKTKQRLDIKVK